MILAGDIGGTKTHLAVFELQENGLTLIYEELFTSRSFTTFDDVLKPFLKRANTKIDAACFGVAGPVIDGNCRTTNLPWNLEHLALKQLLNTQQVSVLNDLETTAYGMLYLSENAFVDLNPDADNFNANRSVIAAGTGLGEATLFWDKTRYHPIGGEGGHSDFASSNELQDRLLAWLRERHGKHISYERVLCGEGIYTLYQFLAQNSAPSLWMDEAPEGIDLSARISEGALVHQDPLCVQTLRLFVEIYGAEAGNMALKSLSLGGVYIGGGIAPKILPFLRERAFMESFLEKGRFKELLKKVPVRVCLNPQTALLGAAHFAKDSAISLV